MSSEEIRIVIEGADVPTDTASRPEHEQFIAQKNAEAAHYRQQAMELGLRKTRLELENARQVIDGAERAAEVEMRAALDRGDPERMIDAQKKLAEVSAQRIQLSQAELQFLQQSRRPADPIEEFISTRTPETAQWLRSHREWLADPAKNQLLTQAHYHAKGEGLREDTPEYFAHVEKRIGLRGANTSGAKRSAPVNPNDVGSHIRNGGQSVTLTKGEYEAATDGQTHVWSKYDLAAGKIRDPNLVGKAIGPKEYARRKVEMHRLGYYDRLG